MINKWMYQMTFLFLDKVCTQTAHLLTGSNKVPDDHLSASSVGVFDGGDFRPTQARLGSQYVNYTGTSMAGSYKFGAGIWAPVLADKKQFIQVPIQWFRKNNTLYLHFLLSVHVLKMFSFLLDIILHYCHHYIWNERFFCLPVPACPVYKTELHAY